MQLKIEHTFIKDVFDNLYTITWLL